MQDLNDLYIFSQVVKHCGFTGAAQALGMARSSVCRRVCQLEHRLGVRLVQRTTRHFSVTDIGKEFHVYCIRIVTEAENAFDKVASARVTPCGSIRLNCPQFVSQLIISPLIPLFCARFPEVSVAIETNARKVSIEENFDVWIRVQQQRSDDSGLIMRSLGLVEQVLVASPEFLERHGRPSSPEEAVRCGTLSYGSIQEHCTWEIINRYKQVNRIAHTPKLIADDVVFIRQAAIGGLGIAQLPLAICHDEIRHGSLEVVLPDIQVSPHGIQAILPSRRGMLPAVRSFIDFIGAHCTAQLDQGQIDGRDGSLAQQCWTDRHGSQKRFGGLRT